MTGTNKTKLVKKQNININTGKTDAYLTIRENILNLCKKNIAQKSLINHYITINKKITKNEYA